MEYYRLYDLRNQYPAISNYTTTLPGKVDLFGLYPETNVIPIQIKNLDGVQFVKGTSFRFVVRIKEKESDTSGRLYTSEKYFKNLEASIRESNPYFINSSFTDIYVVNIFLESFISLFESFIPKEYSAGVVVLKNNFINKDKSIDYDAFVKFLDWVVSPTTLQEIDTNGVIPPQLLINYREFEIDQEKAYYYPDQQQTPETNGGLVNTNNEAAKAEAQRLLLISNIQTELLNINADISTYTELIAQNDYPNSGLSTSTLKVSGTIEEKEYVSGKYLLNRKKQNEDIRKQLTTYLATLTSKKDSLDLELKNLNSNNPTQPTQPTPISTGGSYSGAGGGGNSGGGGGSSDEANNRNDGPSGRVENFR